MIDLAPRPTAPRPDPEAGQQQDVDVVVARLVTIRLLGVRPRDREAVERQFGLGVPASSEPADITIRYRERIDLHLRVLRYLGPGTMGFTDEGLVLLSGRFRRPVRVLFPGADLLGPCELQCEHGVGRVPHLVALVNLALLARGGVALHASAFERDGSATVATGWSKGGKTEALLAAVGAGARFVADEWTHIRPEGTASGTKEPVRAWDWQIAQLPWLQAAIGRADRARLDGLRMLAGAARAGRAGPRVATAIARNRFVDVPPEVVAVSGSVPSPVRIGSLLLMTATDRPQIWTQPLRGREVADRMAASLLAERAPLSEVVAAHRFAFPRAAADAYDDVPEIERERLRALLGPLPAAEVLHPYPVDLEQLGAAVELAEQGLR
ncbi:MAG TPA: hypothetical protein VNS19_08240 [Acidimicrobiales bacterium]|nr:hypothetical protein [Acidimicrobiales bacterium]